MKVQLCTQFGPPLDVSYSDTALPIVLGRGEQADVSIDDRWISRVHCELSTDGTHLFVRDLESKHGTYVNECSVDCAELHPGDRIEIGLTTIVVELEDANSEIKNEGILG